jgi:hypothetical protein
VDKTLFKSGDGFGSAKKRFYTLKRILPGPLPTTENYGNVQTYVEISGTHVAEEFFTL